MPKVLFATPFLSTPTVPWTESLEASVPHIEEAGWEHGLAVEVGNVYISGARASLVKKFLDDDSYDRIFFIDYDLSWEPHAITKILAIDSDVVGGDYRFKKGDEEYMSKIISGTDNTPIVRQDGCIKVDALPGGFMCIKRSAVLEFGKHYTDLLYGPDNKYVDLFNHGAIDGTWWGEDYGFCYRWRKMGGECWCYPNLDIDHHSKNMVYTGNLHEFLLRQPGGSHFKE